MIKRLIPYLKPHWVRLVTAIFAMAAVAGIQTGLMWLLKFLIDSALTQKDVSALSTGVVLILSGFSLKSILWYSHTYLSSYIGQSISQTLRDKTYEHLYKLSIGFFNDKTSSNIMARLTNDITLIQIMLSAAPTVIIRDGLTIIGLIGFLVYLNGKFALMCFAILPVAAFVLVNLGRKSRKASRESQVRMADLYKIIQEGITAMPIVQIFQNEKKEVTSFVRENRNYFNVMMRLVRIEARSSPIMEVLGALVLALMLGVGGRDVVNGTWSTGAFVAFIGAAMSLYNPIKKFAKVNVQLQQGLSASERVFELLDQKPGMEENKNALPADTLSNEIEFKNINFNYPDTPYLFENLSLKIRKGEIVALVGPSGSGKSTIAQLLLRFHDPQTGQVLFDGKDYRDIKLDSLRKQMAIVTQETHLFNTTVAANIEYGRPGASLEEIKEAAKLANAHEFISAFPKGYDSIIGERGTRISGGERQRIAIARALLKNPPILVLDEATSALDAASEQAVQTALDRLLSGRTVLVIAHRLSTVRKAHRIIVLEKGKIVEKGTHEELLLNKGLYHQLCGMQTLGA